MEITKSANSGAHPLDAAAQLVGGRGALAQLLGVSIAAVGNWKSRGVPLEHCVPIERATEGAVTRRDLRPDDWQAIWPELAEPQAPAPAQNTPADAPPGAAAGDDARAAWGGVERRQTDNPPPPDLERREPEAARLAGQGV